MIASALVLVHLLAGPAPTVQAKGWGDLVGVAGDIGKALKKGKKKQQAAEESAEPEDEAAQQAADTDQQEGLGNLLRRVGVGGKEISTVKKSVGLAQRTKKAVADAAPLEPVREWQIGRVVAAEIMHRYKPLEDEALNQYVQTVGQAVAAYSDLPETYSGYHFQVLDSEDLNAISVLGGFVFVTKGMLRLVENEDQLACVLAHEVAHVALGHGKKAIETSNSWKAWLSVAGDAANTFKNGGKPLDVKTLRGTVGETMKVLEHTGYGHDKEFEADAQGAAYAQRTGYDPSALAAVLRKLEASGGTQGGFLKTHPSASKRAERLEGPALAPPAHYRASKTRDKRFAASLAAL